jgi:hypothetical protein
LEEDERKFSFGNRFKDEVKSCKTWVVEGFSGESRGRKRSRGKRLADIELPTRERRQIGGESHKTAGKRPTAMCGLARGCAIRVGR